MSDTLKLGDSEIFMSYGLLTELVRLVPDLDNIPTMVLNSEVRDELLTKLLMKRDARGNPVGEAPSLESLTLEQSEVLIDWAQTHILDFFLRRATKAVAQTKRIQSQLEAYSLTGSAG